MERKIAKQVNLSEGTMCSIIVIAVCWFVLYSPWTRPWVNFWWVLSISSVLISILAGHFHPEWTLDLDVDKKNISIGVALAVLLSLLCHGGGQWVAACLPESQVCLDRIHLFYSDSVYWLLSIFLLLLMGQAEEIFWRGYIQRVFSERWGANAGYLLTSVLFTSMYVWTFNWVLVAGVFLLSLVWGGLCRLDPRWLSPVMLSHALLNVLLFVLFPI